MHPAHFTAVLCSVLLGLVTPTDSQYPLRVSPVIISETANDNGRCPSGDTFEAAISNLTQQANMMLASQPLPTTMDPSTTELPTEPLTTPPLTTPLTTEPPTTELPTTEEPVQIEFNVDRPYFDLPGQPIHLPVGSDVYDCQSECSAVANCMLFAFDTCGTSLCWLKHSVPSPNGNNCRVSSRPLLPNFFCHNYGCVCVQATGVFLARI